VFTDIEGFTAMTHRAEPEALVASLDEYFEGVAQIVIDHGGMVDKFVGDGVHALFNTPLDLADHPVKAVRCAIAIQAWAEAFRQTPRAAELGFGRTRIGVETGDTIVGDVGIRTKLDYTAYGDAVNSAARLEAVNKELGSAICIGPEAASRCPPDLLRPTGKIQLRGFTEAVRTYEPGPTGTDDAVVAALPPLSPWQSNAKSFSSFEWFQEELVKVAAAVEVGLEGADQADATYDQPRKQHSVSELRAQGRPPNNCSRCGRPVADGFSPSRLGWPEADPQIKSGRRSCRLCSPPCSGAPRRCGRA
jgi:class 3 adenylate cyclase